MVVVFAGGRLFSAVLMVMVMVIVVVMISTGAFPSLLQAHSSFPWLRMSDIPLLPLSSLLSLAPSRPGVPTCAHIATGQTTGTMITQLGYVVHLV